VRLKRRLQPRSRYEASVLRLGALKLGNALVQLLLLELAADEGVIH